LIGEGLKVSKPMADSKKARGDIHKPSYDYLTIILKAVMHQLNKVDLKRTHHFINKAPHPKY
jgi:hypothetical protein